jgi:hypothetical protein
MVSPATKPSPFIRRSQIVNLRRPLYRCKTPVFSGRGKGITFDDLTSEKCMTGPELKQLREDLGDAIGRPLSAADMAKLSGLVASNGADTIRKWEVTGPTGSAAELLSILAMASDRYPILDNFNVFERFNIPENQRQARREEFREKMRDEVRRRLD